MEGEAADRKKWKRKQPKQFNRPTTSRSRAFKRELRGRTQGNFKAICAAKYVKITYEIKLSRPYALPVVVIDPHKDMIHDCSTGAAWVADEGCHCGQHDQQFGRLELSQHALH